MNPLLKRTERRSLVSQSAESEGLPVSENNFQAEHHVGDPAVTGHAVTDASFIDHRTDDDRWTIGSDVRQHQTLLPQAVMNSVDARAPFRDNVLECRVDLEDFVHAEHV